MLLSVRYGKTRVAARSTPIGSKHRQAFGVRDIGRRFRLGGPCAYLTTVLADRVARFGLIDRSVEQQVELNRFGHFNEGCLQ